MVLVEPGEGISSGFAGCEVQSLSKMVQWRVRRASLLRIGFHDLRRTHAALALRDGVHPNVVSRGWDSSIGISLDTYSHAIPVMQDEAADRIAALIFDS